MAAAFVGSALEWYDFSIYGTASALVFGELFYPTTNPGLGLLATIGTYAIGFCARPIGALVFGHIGDRHGRKAALATTITLMGAATFTIGLLPTYRQVGPWAPVLLLLLRILQGFGAGAEQAGASLTCAENAPARHRGLTASLAFTGIVLGTMLAAAVFVWAAHLPPADLHTWGWRIPFLLGAFVVGIGLWIRQAMPESPVFVQLRDDTGIAANPIRDALHSQSHRIATVVCMRIGENGTSYLITVLAVTYVVHTQQMGPAVGTQALVVCSLIGLFTLPLWGWLSDRIGRRPVFRGTALFLILFAYPFTRLLDSHNPTLIYTALTLAMTIGVWGMYSVEAAYFPELFQARHRYSALAIAKETGAILGGGLAPVIGAALLLREGSPALAAYIAILAAISLTATFHAPETRGTDLTTPFQSRSQFIPAIESS